MQFEESPAQFGLPAREDYIMWAITLPNRRLPDDEGGSLDSKRLLDVALAESHQFSADCAHILSNTEADDTLLVPLRTTHRLTSSSPLPITLIGDAMHTMPPFGANGANTALRDSDLLTRRLGAVSDGVPAAQALQEYESEMRAYANEVVRSSTQMMASMTRENPLMHLLVMQGLNMAAVIARGK